MWSGNLKIIRNIRTIWQQFTNRTIEWNDVRLHLFKVIIMHKRPHAMGIWEQIPCMSGIVIHLSLRLSEYIIVVLRFWFTQTSHYYWNVVQEFCSCYLIKKNINKICKLNWCLLKTLTVKKGKQSIVFPR